MAGASPSHRIVLAQVGAPHGVKGEVRLKVFADDPASLLDRPLTLPDGAETRVTTLRPLKDEMFVARLEGITTREAAEGLKLRELSVSRETLGELDDEDEFYHADLIGLDARDAEGASIGRVSQVLDFGAGEILEIKGEGAPLLLPFTRANVPTVNLAEGWLTALVPGAVGERHEETGAPADLGG